MRIRLFPNKRIGRVIFFTEGLADEPKLLIRLFHKVLGYEVFWQDPREENVLSFFSKKDHYSKVFIVPMQSSAIKNIPGSEQFLDAAYQKLRQYGLERRVASVYYLFDRDPQSNKPESVEEKIASLKNPLDNGTEFPGALLLSYPCLQAFYCQAHDENITFSSSAEAKKFANSNNLNWLDEKSLCSAIDNMLIVLHVLREKEFSLDELADYSKINREIYDAEEELWNAEGHAYITLSLLGLALLDLGILEFCPD